MDDTSRERCKHISDLSNGDHSFLRLSTVNFLTQVDLISARVAAKLVDTPFEAGMKLRSAVSISLL